MIRIILISVFSLSALTAHAGSGYPTIRVSDDLRLLQLTDKVYIHVSESHIEGYGMVSSNGLVVINGTLAYLIDTPVTPGQTWTLCVFIEDHFDTRITMFTPTHWHDDCMGGIGWLHGHGVDSWANAMTAELAAENGKIPPRDTFQRFMTFSMNGTDIHCYYPGPGHSLDNIVVWLPQEKILFGGCFVKDMSSTNLGNITDGDPQNWPGSLLELTGRYPEAEIIIPGHGKAGGPELVEHTYRLCMQHLDGQERK